MTSFIRKLLPSTVTVSAWWSRRSRTAEVILRGANRDDHRSGSAAAACPSREAVTFTPCTKWRLH